VDALNQKLKKLFDYLDNFKSTQTCLNFRKEWRSSSFFQYSPEEGKLKYHGWDVSGHNGDPYNNVDEEYTLKDNQKEKLILELEELALTQAEKEYDEKLRIEKVLQKKEKVKKYLNSKLCGNSFKFLKEESPKLLSKDKLDKAFLGRTKDAVYFVEADNFSIQVLWERYQNKKYKFETNNSGYTKCVGKIGDKPINIEYSYGIYRDTKFLYWNACSEAVDYSVINAFLEMHRPDIVENKRRANATNFHKCLNYIDSLVDKSTVNFVSEY